jgi:hypothetical protein
MPRGQISIRSPLLLQRPLSLRHSANLRMGWQRESFGAFRDNRG